MSDWLEVFRDRSLLRKSWSTGWYPAPDGGFNGFRRMLNALPLMRRLRSILKRTL
jgi:hypothetical protein